MLGSVFLKTMRDQRVAILGWGLILAILAYITVLFYPSIASLSELDTLAKQYAQFSGFFGATEFTSIDGYMNSSFLSYMPVILAIYIIMAVVSNITGEIESGTMDFLMAHPLPRWRMTIEKYFALVLSTFLICTILGLGMWLGGLTISSDVSFTKWMLAGLNIVPLTLLYGSVAFALACALRGRGIAIGISATLVSGSFILNGLVPFSNRLSSFKEWTIYYWFLASKPLTTGIITEHVIILLTLCLICLVIGIVTFQIRDIVA